MDAVTSLTYAAKGFRKSLGDFPNQEILHYASTLLEAAAVELADIAQLEADTGSPDETLTGQSLIGLALRARLGKLCPGRKYKDALIHDPADCTPGCQHSTVLLLLPDRHVQMLATKALQMRKQSRIPRIGGLGAMPEGMAEMLRHGGMLFVPGMPPPDDDDNPYATDDDDEEEERRQPRPKGRRKPPDDEQGPAVELPPAIEPDPDPDDDN